MKKIIITLIAFMCLSNLFSQTWETINLNSTINNNIRTINVKDGIIYAGVFICSYNGTTGNLTVDWSNSGLWKSSISTINWTMGNNSSLTNRFVKNICIDSLNIWVGTEGFISSSPSLNRNGNVHNANSNFNWTEMINFQSGSSHWVGSTGNVNSIEKINGFIFVCSTNGVFRITNVNDDVVRITNGMTDGLEISSITTKDYYIFCSEKNNGLYRSNDNGNNWTKLSNSSIFANVTKYYQVKVINNYIFLSTNNGVFRSPCSNPANSLSWSNTSLGLTLPSGSNANIVSIASKNSILYAGASTGHIFISSNNGDTWSLLINPPVADAYNFQLLIDNDYLYCMISSKIYRLRIVNCNIAKPVITNTNNVLSTSQYTYYQWLNDYGTITGATNQNYNPISNGNYRVSVTDNSNCSDTSDVYYFENTTSINNFVERPNEINIYPNPIFNELNIRNLENHSNLLIFDLSGKIVYKENTLSSSIVLNLTQLKRGTYILHIQSDKSEKRMLITKI
jgi:hypothetical protein